MKTNTAITVFKFLVPGATIAVLVWTGWHGLNFSSPFAELAIAVSLNWLAMLLYVDAFASPSGTGAIYTATTARMFYAMERNGTGPFLMDGIW